MKGRMDELQFAADVKRPKPDEAFRMGAVEIYLMEKNES